MSISKIQNLLEMGVIPENGDIDVATGDAVIACANELADRLDACANSGPDLDLLRRSPYRPAASAMPHSKA